MDTGATDRPAAPAADDRAFELALEIATALGISCESTTRGRAVLQLPETLRDAWDGADRLVCRGGSSPPADELLEPAGETGAAIEIIAPGSRLFDWLVDQLLAQGKLLHRKPEFQPEHVHELSGRLLGAYQAAGEIRLAGCTLEERPLLRLSYGEGRAVRERFFDAQAEPLTPERVAQLGLQRTVPRREPLRPAQLPELDSWIAAARAHEAAEGRQASPPPLAVAVIWCRFAEGKVSVAVDGEAVTIPFAGWAQLFASGQLAPPPYHCPLSGLESYQLVATDEGQVTVAEAVGVCSESGERVFASSLETCEDSGRRVSARLLADCPLTGRRVLRAAMRECRQCRQWVSTAALRGNLCTACRRLTRIGKHEPRLVRLLGEYPLLERWGGWRISETATVYVLTARTWTERLLLVVDKQSLDLLRVAKRGVWSRAWVDAPAEERDQLRC